MCSLVIGLSTWVLGVAFTFGAFGWIGLVIGLMLCGVGVVPVGCIGAVWHGEPSIAWLLLAMAVSTIVIHLSALAAMASADAATRAG